MRNGTFQANPMNCRDMGATACLASVRSTGPISAGLTPDTALLLWNYIGPHAAKVRVVRQRARG
eukprot:15214382-Alexandrium_andersonii.AAC.1